MKLLIALTPGILIGCALVETWMSIVSRKPPAPAPASVVQARHPAARTVIFAISEKGAAAASTAGLAQLEAPSGKR